jgi:Asp-tRNA(Asn)/Glu-tRNA(Gln) amidotransferase A subunit family amidase
MSKTPEMVPRLFPRPDETIAGVGRALRAGRTTCAAILAGCLEQVSHWEPKVHAWVVLDRDRAREQASRLDDELNLGEDRGPLHGIPIGIKDLVDVAGLPTACGSKRWAGRIAAQDARVVANLREAGAVILGKTVTTPYACIDPPVTRNPWNLDRTPGGSSSGSAAAVACGMCLGAIGTQTGGSITRPASFCGVAGMKPTYGWVSTHGVLPLSPSLDHVGSIARTVDGLRLMFGAMREARPEQQAERAGFAGRKGPPRLGRPRGFFDRRAETVLNSAFDLAVAALAIRGAEIVQLEDPVDFEAILTDHRRVVAPEAARVHSHRLDTVPDDYPSHVRELILEGRSLLALEYLQARDRMDGATAAIQAALARENLDALITPAAVGTAPDPGTTGDAAFNSPWSYTHLPTVSFPIGLAADGLPVAVQLVGDLWTDLELLQTAERCVEVIRTWRQ